MAQAEIQLDKQAFSCTICLDFLKDPATLPCGHNYCRSCIQNYWDVQKQSSCPQCRQIFKPRPTLVKNTMLAELVEKLQRIELHQSLKGFMLESDASSKKTQMKRWILCTIQDKETALQKLQQEALSFRRSADEVVKSSDQSFNSVVQELEEVHSEVTRQIKELQEKEKVKVKQLHDQLQRDITLLRMTVSELDSLTPGQALQHCPPLSALDPPRTYSLPLGSLEQAASAVTAFTDLLRVTLKDGLQNISQGFRPDQHPPPRPEAALSLPEPKTRDKLINYAREIVLDPNTAHPDLTLSRGNRRVTNDPSGAFDHPDRFSDFIQVLSRDGLTGRCYWEVEWMNYDVIAVSYKNIKRKGDSEESEFGFNDKSWALQGKGKAYYSSFWHHSVETKISGPVSDRIGVYLDHSAGVLAFYTICKDRYIQSLIHRVQTTFTQPLYAGVRFFKKSQSVTAYFPKLK